jgi:hypothetical protein
MTKKEWEQKTEAEKLDYIFSLGVKSCQGIRSGKSADKEYQKILDMVNSPNGEEGKTK